MSQLLRNDKAKVLALLAEATGSSLIGHRYGASWPAVTLAYSGKKRAHLVFDLGAVGDGIANDTAVIQSAIAAGISIDAGGPEFTYKTTAALGTLADAQQLTGQGAKITTNANSAILQLSDWSLVSGIWFSGFGKNSGQTSQHGIKATGAAYEGPSRWTVANCKFTGLGGSAIEGGQVVQDHEGAQIFGNFVDSCHVGLNVGERGEYWQLQGGSVTNCNTAVIVTGGNTNLGGMAVSNNAIGFYIAPGENDAHGQVWGFTANHNTVNIKVGAINTKSFAFHSGSVYSGKIVLDGCQGVRFHGVDIGNGVTIDENGAINCAFINCNFFENPTVNANNGSPSMVFYIDCTWPVDLVAGSSRRINGAYSEVAQLATYPTIATGTTHTFKFPDVVYNSLAINTVFTHKSLYATASGLWDFEALFTPGSSWWAEFEVNLSVGRLGATLNRELVDVYLCGASGERLATLKASDLKTYGSDTYAVWNYSGRVQKTSGAVGIRIANATGANIVVFNDAPVSGFLTRAKVTGW